MSICDISLGGSYSKSIMAGPKVIHPVCRVKNLPPFKDVKITIYHM